MSRLFSAFLLNAQRVWLYVIRLKYLSLAHFWERLQQRRGAEMIVTQLTGILSWIVKYTRKPELENPN
jgi:hypothetical protein